MDNLEKLKDYLESEYRSTVRLLTRDKIPYWCDSPRETKHMALQRGLGAVMYAQYLGEKFNDVDIIYDEYKKRIEDIIPTKERGER